MSMNILGFDSTTVDTNSAFIPGQENNQDSNGKGWIYVLAGSGGLTANQACFIDESYTAVAATTTNATYGGLVGVPVVAIAAASYGWLQTFGNALVNVAASCAADVRLNTTATAGRLDDDGTGGSKTVANMKLNVAAVGAGDVSCYLNNPYIGATL